MTRTRKGLPEATLNVAIRRSTADDLVVVLRKFCDLRMEELLPGQTEKATRILGLNLFRHEVEGALEREKARDPKWGKKK